LFKLKNRPQWYTVSNRSRTYVENILSKISGEHFKNYQVTKIKSNTNGIDLYYGGENEFFNYDKVVLATHADEALSMIEDPSEDEKKILPNFSYKENIAYIHTDEKVMPKNKKAWSSWNSSIKKNEIEKNSITYWLNLLQNLKCEENIFLTLNPYFEIDASKVLKKVKFTHPYFDQSALTYQSKLKNLQNKRNILFCGSYFGYGFHEDGIKSSIEMLKNLND
jgi:predicted NAD/FAD-binding protein